MHPAFSVIFFSTLTGLGYGLWIWSSLDLLLRPLGVHAAVANLGLLVAGAVLVAIGLISSTFHLGKPLRGWRAFSQWRTSWLSREAVMAVAAFVPWSIAVLGIDGSGPLAMIGTALGVLVVASLATVVCTAMIYASLKPVPAWTHATVVPNYLLFSLLTGGLPAAASIAAIGGTASGRAHPGEADQIVSSMPVYGVALLLLSVALVVGKRRYWRDLDRGTLPATRSSALGLPGDRVATVFERPHTEASYLTKEMGFIVARKHSKRLRAIALILFGGVPVLACVLSLLWPPAAAPAFGVAAVAALLGTLVERWLFFAEAKHLVTLYY